MALFSVKTDKNGEPVFKRWTIISTPWFSIYLHCLLKSEELPHDHPWDFHALILKGCCREHLWRMRNSDQPIKKTLPCVCNYLSPWETVKRNWHDARRMEVVRGPVWSLVFTGKNRGNWGYFTMLDESPTEKRKNETTIWIDHETHWKMKLTEPKQPGEKHEAQ